MYDITQEHPQLDFIRKSFNSVLFNFNDQESMKLSFLNNFDRDLFVLVVRSYVANAIKVDHLGARSDSA